MKNFIIGMVAGCVLALVFTGVGMQVEKKLAQKKPVVKHVVKAHKNVVKQHLAMRPHHRLMVKPVMPLPPMQKMQKPLAPTTHPRPMGRKPFGPPSMAP